MVDVVDDPDDVEDGDPPPQAATPVASSEGDGHGQDSAGQPHIG